LALHHALPSSVRNRFLLLASYGFYAWLAPRFVGVLAGITLVTFVVGARVLPSQPRRQAWLGAGVSLILGCLLLLRAVYPINPFTQPFAVIGVSFYTLQAISYLVDLYSGHLRIRGSLTAVALYLAYFPKLLAGPIERAPVFFERLRRPHSVDDDVLARAFVLLAIGITRKVAIADPLRQLLPDAAFTTPHEVGAASLAIALIGFAIVLYNDFAGYTQIMRGVSLLFGIELSANFAQPFFATSFSDFWNRWHITLSHWLRDYIYLPLSRRMLRRDPRLWNVSNLVLPPLATMLASGLWHGGSWHMLIWGALHGSLLIVERVVTLLRRPPPGARASRLASLGMAVFVFLAGVSAF
jgi:D-alanyl-lipoteichoic acid acyltransferase DltB (MBOAT superfamily)